MTHRKEVLDFMNKIGLKTSLEYWVCLCLGGTILAYLMGMVNQILFLLTILTIISIFAHFVVKHLSKGWYSYYEALYDYKQTLLKFIDKAEKISPDEDWQKLKKMALKI